MLGRMTGSGELDVAAILVLLEEMHDDEVPDSSRGLRELKKRRLRQKISDVATAMFLVHGFDEVTVSRIAAACEVSEQTVFNYFPTKESMLFDRGEPTINAVADAVRKRGNASLTEAVVQALAQGIQHGRRGSVDEARQLQVSRLFANVVAGSPTLAGAQFADFERLIDEVSVALAARVGLDPADPKVQLATLVIAGLARVRQQSTFRHVQQAASLASLDAAVHRDLASAARLAEPTLTAFDRS